MKNIDSEQFIRDFALYSYKELRKKYSICDKQIVKLKKKYNLMDKPKGRHSIEITCKEVKNV